MNLAIEKRRYIVDSDSEVDANDNRIKRVKKSNGKTKVTELNDDCLEKLFLYLCLRDLASICVSNTRFSHSSTYVFRKLHANTLIVFDPFAANGKIFNDFLNMLDAFGDHIKRLQVTFYHEQRYRKRNQQIFDRIVEKCSKSVTELNLSNIHNNMDNMNISKPFLHLEKFTLNDSFFNDSMTHLIRMSTNISCVEFHGVENVFNPSFIEQNVPLMKHFGNYNQVITDSEVENLQKFRRFVNANEQLTSLGVGERELEMMFRYEEVRKQFFKTIHRKLPYPDQPNHITYLLPFESVYFGHLKHLSLSLGYSTDFLRCVRERRLTIESLPLDELELRVGHFNLESVHFILRCRQLRKLQLYVRERLDMINIAAVALNLAQLHELQIFLLYNENPKLSIIPDTLSIIIKNGGHPKRIVFGFQITKPSHSTNPEYETETARNHEAIFMESFSKHLPRQWSINFETDKINRHNSYGSFFLCAILEQQSMK